MRTHWNEARKSREELAQMGTEKLKEIIRLDSQGVEIYPTEDIFYILELIVHREKTPEEIQAETAAAWSRFQRDYLDREEETQAPTPDKVRRWKRRPRGLGITAAALALVFVGMLTARAAGWDILGGLAKWNDEFFTFGSLEPEDPVDVEPEDIDTVSPDQKQESEIITPEVLEYDTLQEALDACGITEVKAPTWLPEGCQFQTVEQSCNPDGTFYELYATYKYQENLLAINVIPVGPDSAGIEKVEKPVDTTDMHGHTVYIIKNINNFTVAWKIQRYEFYLFGPSQTDLEKIAQSMLA